MTNPYPGDPYHEPFVAEPHADPEPLLNWNP